MQFRLAESIEDAHIHMYKNSFIRKSKDNQIAFKDRYMNLIAEIYAVNMVLEYFGNNLGNGVWPKGITYDFIACIDEHSVKYYNKIIVQQKNMLINILFKEVEMVRRLMESYVRVYGKMLESAEKIDIHTLDQTCANIDKTVGHIRKIIIKIPTIVNRKRKIDLKNKYKKDKGLQELRRKKKENIKKYRLIGNLYR